MTFDLALILVVAAILTGVIWASYAWVLRPRRELASGGGGGAPEIREPVIVEYARSFFPVIVIVLVVRSFLFEPFRIPSSSMLPTLHVGDFIFVNKYVYGLRVPVLNKKVFEVGEPRRGDVVVFRLPADPSTNYIKRVVGLPGDRVAYRGKRLRVNGELVELDMIGPYTERFEAKARIGLEQLGDADHEILHIMGRSSQEGEWQVPEGHYFMMGDNRDNSTDSRYDQVSVVPESNLVGRAVRIWMSWDKTRFLPVVWSRIGDRIH